MMSYKEFRLRFNVHPIVAMTMIQADRLFKEYDGIDSFNSFYEYKYKQYCKAGIIKRFFILKGLA